MKNLNDVLQKKVVELREIAERAVVLQKEVDVLRLAMKLCADEEEPSQNVANGDMTHWQAIRAVLLERGRPMHAKDIAETVNARFGRQIDRDFVSSMIYRYIRKNQYFKKAKAGNTFGLIEWSMDDEGGHVSRVLDDLLGLPEKIAPQLTSEDAAPNHNPVPTLATQLEPERQDVFVPRPSVGAR